MDKQKVLDQILAKVTPEHLQEIILGIANAQTAKDRSTVSFFPVLDALISGQDLGSSSETWSAQVKIKKAIIKALKQIPEMRYIEGDA